MNWKVKGQYEFLNVQPRSDPHPGSRSGTDLLSVSGVSELNSGFHALPNRGSLKLGLKNFSVYHYIWAN